MTMAEEERSPGTDVVDVFIAIGVEDVGALASDDEGRCAADSSPSAYRGVDAAGDYALGAVEELLGFGVGHLW